MTKLFKKLKAEFKEAIAYNQGKANLQSEENVVPGSQKLFQKYLEKRLNKQEIVEIEKQALLEAKIHQDNKIKKTLK